jgi:hypothetical protein
MIIVLPQQRRLPKRVEMTFIATDRHLLNVAHMSHVTAGESGSDFGPNSSYIYMANGAELGVHLPLAVVQARIAAAYAAGPGVH